MGTSTHGITDMDGMAGIAPIIHGDTLMDGVMVMEAATGTVITMATGTDTGMVTMPDQDTITPTVRTITETHIIMVRAIRLDLH